MSIEQFVRDTLGLLPEEVRLLPYIAGGALRSQYDGTAVNDIDLFFRSESDYTRVREALIAHADFRYEGHNGSTLHYRHITGADFNLVGFLFCSPHEKMNQFDFRCTRIAAWLEHEDGALVYRSFGSFYAVADCRMKRLVVLNNNGTARTAKRITKYVEKYGYTLDIPIPGDEPELAEDEEHEGIDAHLPAWPIDQSVKSYLRRLRPCATRGYGD